MKLSPISILLLGIMVAVIALSYAFFRHVKPNQADTASYVKYKEALQVEANKQKRAEERFVKAREEVKTVSDRWQQTVARRTPGSTVSSGGINLEVNRYDLTVHARMFRDNVQRAVNRQVRSGGVTVVQGASVPAPDTDPRNLMAGYFNYPAMGHPVAVFNLGTITVRGTFSQISDNIRSWTNMPNYLAVADGLQITGTSPVMTGTYNLTVVAFVRGKKIAPAVPEGSGGGAGGTSQAGGGGAGAGGGGRGGPAGSGSIGAPVGVGG